ncbi:MAG: hypothetical protein KatS3mg105_0414 [Gemmatales bacterium]|nr:MAG: hypothetical protein KatS3mg105_0414 [Gemmatales bacterium]
MITRNRLLAIAFLSGLFALGAAVQARAPVDPLPKKIYTRRSVFQLPVSVDQQEIGRLSEIVLYVKEGPKGTWQPKQFMTPTRSQPLGTDRNAKKAEWRVDPFVFKVPHDGEYWFVVATVDKDGVQHPADLTQEMPGLIVVVDSQAPDCEIHSVTSPSGEILFHCEIRDQNPDIHKTRLEYLRHDQSWQPLKRHPAKPGFFFVPDPVVLSGTLRATVFDLAGNKAEHIIDAATHEKTSVQQAKHVVRKESIKQTPPNPLSHAIHESKPLVSETEAPETRSAKSAAAGNSPLMIVPHHQVSMAYELQDTGPSGIGKIEVWWTRDEGRTWNLLCDDPDLKSPVSFALPGDGLYGISLVVQNGNGEGGSVPKSGCQPDCWIEVDSTRPVAQLLLVRPVFNASQYPELRITWTAADKNLQPNPVNLYYASDRQGPWTPIALGISNSGRFHWKPATKLQGPVFIRLEVSDQAGNTTRCETSQPVVLNMSKPKAKIVSVVPRASVPEN